MSNDFKNKLQLYRKGMLSESETASIEEELEKYEAIKEYLDNTDEEYIEKLKEEMDNLVPQEKVIRKNINRKMIKRIISISLATILTCLILIPISYISISSLLGKMFRINSTRFVQEENFAKQFLNIIYPKVISIGGEDHTEFYNQNFTVKYIKGISHKASQDEIEVNYSFGRLKKNKGAHNKPLEFFYRDQFYAINSQTYFNSKEWDYLEKAPKGTNAQIFITFKSKLSPQQALTTLGQQYMDSEKKFNITMLADVKSEIVLGNMNPAYYYEKSNSSLSKQDELTYINKFNSYDNDIQKQVLLFELNEIKKHKNIADYITANYSNGKTIFKNIDNSISYVKENGVQYVGALITGDTKELLKLRNNPNIYACSVEEIVVW